MNVVFEWIVCVSRDDQPVSMYYRVGTIDDIRHFVYQLAEQDRMLLRDAYCDGVKFEKDVVCQPGLIMAAHHSLHHTLVYTARHLEDLVTESGTITE